MELWLTDQTTNQRQTLEVNGEAITIGRDPTNTIPLKSVFIAKQHARLFRRGNQLYVEALSRAGTRVANREVLPGAPAKIDFGDEIQIGPYTLAPVGRDRQGPKLPEDEARLRQAVMDLEQAIHTDILERLNLRVTGSINKADQRFIEQVRLQLQQVVQKHAASLTPELALHISKTQLERLVAAEVVRQCEGKVQTDYKADDLPIIDPHLDQAIDRFVATLVDQMPLLFDPTSVTEDLDAADEAFPDLFEQELPHLTNEVRRYLAARTLAKDIQDILFGLGPLQDLLEMPSVSEIMVVGKDHIYIEKQGVIQPASRTFFSEEVLLAIIERILTPVGRRVDTSTPLVDARLPDGSRVNVVINPLSLVGPCMTIRKFGWVPFTMDDLIDRLSISEPAAAFLQGCITGRKNIVISGGTGSGKTTLLNVLSAYARPTERIITIEESAELQLPQPHVVRLEGRPANVEGRGAYTIRDLVKNALRMRPDRIIIGEVRGPEAMDMLQAMNTGHDGSLSTLHANVPADAVKRLEALVLMAVDMPMRAIREQIVTAVDLIVQVTRLPNGRRRVTHISEITAIDPDTNEIRLEDIFTLRNPEQPALRHSGYLPSFTDELLHRNCFDVNVFL
ncbi:MAG: ATPase, T2SS/T4P/T4SS family [Planctomycetota bacterium]